MYNSEGNREGKWNNKNIIQIEKENLRRNKGIKKIWNYHNTIRKLTVIR